MNKAKANQIQNVTYERHRVPVTKTIDGVTNKDSFWVEAEQARIMFNDVAVIVILADGSKGVAKCHESDNFNPRIGVKLAYNRAKIISLQKDINQIRRSL